MPLVKISKACKASENGITIIEFTKDQIVDVSEPMSKILITELKRAKLHTNKDIEEANAKTAAAEKAGLIATASFAVKNAEAALGKDKANAGLKTALAEAQTALDALTG